MPKVNVDMKAPDFTLEDLNGKPIRLSDYEGKNYVILVFNRGFI